MEEQGMNISKEKLESILKDSILENDIEKLPPQIDVVFWGGDFDYAGEKSFDVDFKIPNTDKIKFTNVAVYKGFPRYVKPHDIYKLDYIKGYSYDLDGEVLEFYTVDRNYFVARENDMIVLKDIYIDRVESSDYSMNNIYSLDKKTHGANHLFQICDKADNNNSIAIAMQKGGRNEADSEWGVLDIDLLSIVKSRLSQFIDSFDDEDTKDANYHVCLAIESLEHRYKKRKEEGTLGNNIKEA